jgi:hypothetical protein
MVEGPKWRKNGELKQPEGREERLSVELPQREREFSREVRGD